MDDVAAPPPAYVPRMTSQGFLELSQALSALVAEAAAGVVRVDARHRGPASGVVWGPGVVVTASHAVESEEGIEIGLPSGGSVRAELAGRDPSTDVAVLRAAPDGLTPARWSDASLDLGALLVIVTRPGRSPRTSLGMLSRLGDAWRTPAGGKVDRDLELDVALQPGLSGGLVVDAGGRAAGMVTAGLARGTAIALPFSTLRRVVEGLLAHGVIRRGYLGVATLPVRVPAAVGAGGVHPTALLVTAVEGDSPASRAGVMLGDLLLELDGRPLNQLKDLLPLLDEERIGTTTRARVARAGAVQELSITIGTRGGREGGGRP